MSFNVPFMATLSIRGFAAALVGGLTNIWGPFGAGGLIRVAEGVRSCRSPIFGIADAALALTILALMVVPPSGLVRSAY